MLPRLNQPTLAHNSIYNIHSSNYSISISLLIGVAISILWIWLALNLSSVYQALQLFIFIIFSLQLLLLTQLSISGWIYDLWIESHFGLSRSEQYFTIVGIKLLLISELMLFFACFWLLINYRYLFIIVPLCSFHSFINYCFSWSNALILQLSSLPIQSSQLFIKIGSLSYAIESWGQGLLCSFLFIGLQLTEMLFSYYSFSGSSLSSSMIGSIFYLTTGLHGFHVLIGSMVCLMLLLILVYFILLDELIMGSFISFVLLHSFLCLLFFS